MAGPVPASMRANEAIAKANTGVHSARRARRCDMISSHTVACGGAGGCRVGGARSLRRAIGLAPAPEGGIVGRPRLHPPVAAGALLLLPERRAALEIVHQEFGGSES